MLEIIIVSIPLLIAIVVSFMQYNKQGPSWLRLITWFCMITLVIQPAGYYYVALSGIKNNIFIFNIYIFIEYGFYLLVFYKAIQRRSFKQLAIGALAFFLVFHIYQIFILHPFSLTGLYYSSISIIVGGLLALLLCFFYLSELLMAAEQVDFLTTPMFWMATGIMVQIVGTFIYMACYNYIISHGLDDRFNYYAIINIVCSFLQYSLFAIGFLCTRIWKAKVY